MKCAALRPIAPGSYLPNPLHAMDRPWAETNCYMDVWIEVLHALGLNPLAAMSVTLGLDFDGDQWTFYKPSHDELFELYGIDVQELNVWKGLLANSVEQLGRGRLVLTEVDAFYLPDTSGTDYRRNHVKTTIAIQELDSEANRLGYFHNGGYHHLDGDDFTAIFRVGFAPDPTHMPFFAELARVNRVAKRSDAELAPLAFKMVRKHLARRPESNPFVAFKASFLAALPELKAKGLEAYHAYAFANLRQFGSAFDLAATELSWLREHGQPIATEAVEAFARVSATTKAMLLKGARAVVSPRPTDLTPMLDELITAYDQGMQALTAEF